MGHLRPFKFFKSHKWKTISFKVPHENRLSILVFTDQNVGLLNIIFSFLRFKGRVHCFSMQVVMNKCFLLNSEKKFGTDPSCRFREKRKNLPLIPKNDVTDPKARLL